MTQDPIDITRFRDRRIMVVGDLMIDEYLWGEVDRISPEAPVQVVSVHRESLTLGGAGNVVNNLVALGADVCTVGVVGTGRNAHRLLELFRAKHLDTRGIVQEPLRTTTRKTRVIGGSQHVLRIDRESRTEVSPATLDAVVRFVEERMPVVDLVLISDYGKGLVTEPLLRRLTAAARLHDKPTVADPKGLDFTKYRGVFLLTPNQKEAALASGIEIVDADTLDRAGRKILETAAVESLLITCGKDGMALFRPGLDPHRIRSRARQVFDVSGAGDTVLAVLGLALAAGNPLVHAAAVANTAAGIVVGKVGTATVSVEELSQSLADDRGDLPAKHKTLDELSEIASGLKAAGKKIVLTNGCFDLIHGGHVEMLAASKRLGDVLIVALDNDASVQRLKGPGRPVIAARERVRILGAMDAVDYVTVFASRDLETLVNAVRPDVLTKGSNFTRQSVKSHERVEKLGGRVVLIPVSGDLSSTKIIRDIKNGK